MSRLHLPVIGQVAPVLGEIPGDDRVLVDGLARRIRYLRISVTDRCNFRCSYCMPESLGDQLAFEPRAAVLTFEELERLARVFARLGVRKLRLTGGEPTVRKGIVELTGLSTFQVCKALSQMLDAGLVAPVAAEELLPLAAECMAASRLQDAISLYERAVSLGVGVPQVHSLAATAYQAAAAGASSSAWKASAVVRLARIRAEGCSARCSAEAASQLRSSSSCVGSASAAGCPGSCTQARRRGARRAPATRVGARPRSKPSRARSRAARAR